MDSDDTTFLKQRRQEGGRMSIGNAVSGLALLLAITALAISCYFGAKIGKLEDEQLVMKTLLNAYTHQDNSEKTISKRDAGGPEDYYRIPLLRGPPGRDGKDGRDGRDCDQVNEEELLKGINESIGHALLIKMQQTLAKLEDADLGESEEETSGTGGSTYVRWGRTTCGSNSELVYKGFVGGQHYTHSGGASNYQCLPLDPEYSKINAGTSSGTFIYGAEYEHEGNLFPGNMQDQNVPCARCYTAERSTTIMVPAKITCPRSWTKEYEGYLMAGHHSHKRAYNYACVDKTPESVAGKPGNENGALFYPVQGVCSSIGHCPPYVEGSELTCVVCSK